MWNRTVKRRKGLPFLYMLSLHLGRSWTGGSSGGWHLTDQAHTAKNGSSALCSLCCTTLLSCWSQGSAAHLTYPHTLTAPEPTGPSRLGPLVPCPLLQVQHGSISLSIPAFLSVSSGSRKDMLGCRSVTGHKVALWTRSLWPNLRLQLQPEQPGLLTVSGVGAPASTDCSEWGLTRSDPQ